MSCVLIGRVLQLRQDMMDKQAAEQRASGGPITGPKQ